MTTSGIFFRYCRQVIDESLRLSVLAPYAARVSNIDLKIGGHVVPKEVHYSSLKLVPRWIMVAFQTPIIQALGVALTDPTLWPEPAK